MPCLQLLRPPRQAVLLQPSPPSRILQPLQPSWWCGACASWGPAFPPPRRRARAARWQPRRLRPSWWCGACAVLDLAALDLLDSLGDVGGDGAELGVGHHAARAEDLAESADLGHHVRRGDGSVEVDVASLDIGNEVVRTDDVSTGILCLLGLVALGKDGDADGLAGAVGQRDGTADLLICLTGVDVQTEMGLDALVEVRRGNLLGELCSLHRGVELISLDLLEGCLVFLAVLSHEITSLWYIRAFGSPT